VELFQLCKFTICNSIDLTPTEATGLQKPQTENTAATQWPSQ